MRNPRLTGRDLAEAEEWARQMSGLYGADGWLARRWTLPGVFPRDTLAGTAQESAPPSAEQA